MDRSRFVTDPKGSMLALFGATEAALVAVVREALLGADDGELFVERKFNRSIVFEGGKVESLSYKESGGIGLRRIVGEAQYYASGDECSLEAVRNFGEQLSSADSTGKPTLSVPVVSYSECYAAVDPLAYTTSEAVEFLSALDARIRAHELSGGASVTDVELSITEELQVILIVRSDGFMMADVRPMSTFNIGMRAEKDGKGEWGRSRLYGRCAPLDLLNASDVERVIADAQKTACDLLIAEPCPSGNMPVVVSNGWGGILVHEAVGHALEADAIRKKDSVFAGKLGAQVASLGVTIIDDGTLFGLRGSLNVDDEGTKTESTVLIENGMLKTFMSDRLSARVLGLHESGSSRRESYRYPPQVRMRNTFVAAGTDDPKQIITDTAFGLFVKDFSGGMVEPRTGKFTFTADVAYVIKDGVIAYPVRGVTLIGDCREALLHIDRVGNDLALSAGSCGKGGQTVPVCVGQPTLRLAGGITVGGTV